MTPRVVKHRRSRRSSQLVAAIQNLETRRLLTVFNPVTSADFTSALNNAQLGDTINLQAGTTYTGNFILKNKTTGSGWITIQSSNLANIAAGVRVAPSDATNMPRIQSPGSNVSARCRRNTRTAAARPSAHHYKLLGLEFVGPANNTDLVNLTQFGTTDPVQDTLQEMPHDFVIDRCYFHPNTNMASPSRHRAQQRRHRYHQLLHRRDSPERQRQPGHRRRERFGSVQHHQ